MTELHPNIVFISGLVIIILGAELLLRGATRVAAFLKIRPIIVGLTIVSIGTSAPEFAIGVTAVYENRGSLAVGNIAGTNILNILFILGLSATIRPLPIRMASIKLEVPFMILTAIALFIMAWDGVLGQFEGVLLILAAILYTIILVRESRKETTSIKKEYAEEYSAEAVLAGPTDGNLKTIPWSLILFVGGLLLTLLGADLLVNSAASIARTYGVSDAIIGLTIVAIGTSAPELATTVLSTIKNDRDVAIGNLIGSSIYNVLFILGGTCALSPGGVEVGQDVLWIDLPLAAAVAIVCYPVFKSDRLVSRNEGLLFVTAYLIYLGTLIYLRT